MREEKAWYQRELGSLPGFTPFQSGANFLLVRYPFPLKPVLRLGLQQRDIAVRFIDGPGVEDCMRITIGTHEQNMRFMESLYEIIGEDLRAAIPAERVKR